MRILKADERWVLILWCYEDLSYNEIAVYTGFTLSNVKIKLHRAKQQLKQELEPFKNHFYE
jgi:RNA polymerase sigma-70 factor (ECF subfamily)